MDYEALRWSVGIIFALSAGLCLLLNSLVLLAFIVDPLKKLRRLFNSLLIHLCLCDLLAGLACFPITAYGSFALDDERLLFSMRRANYATLPLINGGFYTTMMLSYDRYKAVTEPIKYRQNADAKRLTCYLGVIWIVSAVLSGIFFSFKTITDSITMNFVLCVPVTITLIFFFVHIRSALSREQRSDSINSTSSTEELLLTEDGNENVILRRSTKEKRALKTCKLILWLQILTIICVIATDIYIVAADHQETIRGQLVLAFVFRLPLIVNTLGNPLICIFRMTEFKKSIQALFTSRMTFA